LLGVALVLLLPLWAEAHGEHGSAKPLGELSLVTVQGYQVELLSRPSPLALGQESQVVAKVFRNSPLTPVSGGRVLIGLAPAGMPSDLRPAPEVTWAGSYAAVFTPKRMGAHQIRVVLTELDGLRFEPPLLVDFHVRVGRAPGMGATVWTLLALVGGVAALAVYGVALRARIGRRDEGALNLLEIPWLRRLLTSRALQPSLQIPLLLLMGVVVLLGLFDVQDGGVNLATKLTWTIWWAGIIFTFFLVGRVWCLACPFGALNEWAARLAASSRRLPKPFRNIWWATGMFVLLTWADEQLGVVRSPRVTAWIVLFFAALAAAVGLFYARRSFCRYLCPIGGLIGIYSMTAPLELRAKDGSVCARDRDKPCYRGSEGARGCPMFEFPPSMDRNNYCHLCGQCVKGCPRDNLVLRFRAFGKDLWASRRRLLEESYLAVALVGLTLLVTAQMLTAWPDWMSALARWLPVGVRSSLKPVTYLSLVESAILLAGALGVVPLLILAGAALADRLAGQDRLGLRRAFVVFGYMFIPVGLAMHLAHNLAHLLLEGGGIVPVVQRAVALYTPFSLGEPDWQVLPLAAEPVVTFLQMAVVVGSFALSLAAGHRLALRFYPDPRTASRALIPMAALSLVFTVAGIVLLNQPMGMRHGM
ncbi:MAG: 4Fe-4S binding protein, partial [Candidatus Rokubacteria bacterium]|nr:4Fe-4S binding protein [Candidatus Rokubacteria bacterium]